METSNTGRSGPAFSSLPAEIRMHIFEFVFSNKTNSISSLVRTSTGALFLNDHYLSSDHLLPLLVCRTWYQDTSLFAFSHTRFLSSNLFCDIPQRITSLHTKQISSISSLALVADKRHFRKLSTWKDRPFGIEALDLETLTIVLHRSSSWHYMFDYTTEIVKLLRVLRGVNRLVFVRNGAMVKGSFRTWYNRLVGLMLKMDHQERYDRVPPNLEQTWWTWEYDEVGQSFCLQARPSKPLVDEEEYMQNVLPLMEELRDSMELEEVNPDVRATRMYY